MKKHRLKRLAFKAYKAYVNNLTREQYVDCNCEHGWDDMEGSADAGIRTMTGGEKAIGTVTIGPPWGKGIASRDSDNVVPEFKGDYPWKPGTVGKTTWHSFASRTVFEIRYHAARMKSLGAGRSDWQRLKAHERAHARRFNHFEGTPKSNPAYYPATRITGQ